MGVSKLMPTRYRYTPARSLQPNCSDPDLVNAVLLVFNILYSKMCSIRGSDFRNHFSVYGLYVMPNHWYVASCKNFTILNMQQLTKVDSKSENSLKFLHEATYQCVGNTYRP